VPAPEGVWAWRRGELAMVALNLSDREITLEGIVGRVLVGTDPERADEAISGALRLGAWEGVITELAGPTAA
jgi:Domain of unknown function (DUF3459)